MSDAECSLLPQLVFGCRIVVGDGDAVLRLGLDDSIFNRFPPTGVDALKSNGDEARARFVVDVVEVAAAAAAAADIV